MRCTAASISSSGDVALAGAGGVLVGSPPVPVGWLMISVLTELEDEAERLAAFMR